MTDSAEIELIAHVGKGEPMGEMLRRYWIPAMLADELPDPDGAPKAIRLLGEDLVAFRDTAGRVGIMDIHCPHRLSSLALGRNEEGGLRCLYHGWKIDVEGKILETPCELPTSRLKDHIMHMAYPVREAADLIWVYMGPPDQVPAFPDFNWMRLPSGQRSIGKMRERCNYVQSMEGIFDSYHTNLLHSGWEVLHWTDEQIGQMNTRPSRTTAARVFNEGTDYGYHYAAIREASQDGTDVDYVRITEFVAPFYCMNPPDMGTSSKPFIFVPIDDYNTILYEVQTSEGNGKPMDHAAHLRMSSMRVGEDLDESYRSKRNETNNYGQDRALMRAGVRPNSDVALGEMRHAYSGIYATQHQDMAMIETMGVLSDRDKEHLGGSDIGIIGFRNRLVEAVRSFIEGGEPPALSPPVGYTKVRSVSALVPKGDDWRSVTWSHASEDRQLSEPAPVAT
jgi:phthalate 4,5-dioxygenase oxygenase subunit